MRNYLKNWDFMRVLRLTLGVFIIVQGVQTKEWLFVFAGALFSLMPILNMGCCGTSACSTLMRNNHKKTEDITYEEIN